MFNLPKIINKKKRLYSRFFLVEIYLDLGNGLIISTF